MAPVVIVTGMPGAGKTTVSDLAARQLPRGVQVGGDTVARMAEEFPRVGLGLPS